LLLVSTVALNAQELRLSDCIRESRNNNPLNANKELATRIAGIKKGVIRAAWYPTIDMNGQATWQSEVVALSLDLPFPVDLPQIPRDQYKVTADFTQLIYDGGSLKKQGVLEDITADLTVAELEVKELDLRQMVEELFFAILVIEKRQALNEYMTASVDATISQVESGVRNGTLSESELPVLLAEKIRIGQQMISLEGLRNRAINALGLLMGRQIGGNATFLFPGPVNLEASTGLRPEYKVFDLQGKMMEARKDLLGSLLLPRFMAFSQAGYGKPGLNFLGDQWDPYLLIGVKGTWNIWDWGKVKRQKESLALSQTMLSNQQTAFARQVNQAVQGQGIISNELDELLKMDDNLVMNREKVTAAYASRLMNGLVTASQYLTEWTREQEARISREVRKIERVREEYKLLTIQGK
jgi:outer membrane protein TolC